MKISVDKSKLSKLANDLEKLVSTVPKSQRKFQPFKVRASRKQEAYWNPAELLVAAALVNQASFKSVVIPRLERFRFEHRGVDSIAKLRKLVDSLNDAGLCKKVLHFGTGQNPKEWRAPLLRGLVHAFDGYSRKVARGNGKKTSDYEVLRAWAREPNPRLVLLEANHHRKIRGCGPKLVDWLRMYGGDEPTVPLDVNTMRGMKALGMEDSGKTAEFIARLFRISPYTLNRAFHPKVSISPTGQTKAATN